MRTIRVSAIGLDKEPAELPLVRSPASEKDRPAKPRRVLLPLDFSARQTILIIRQILRIISGFRQGGVIGRFKKRNHDPHRIIRHFFGGN